ncbi:hypothetical protein [Microcoleus sp. bin38.metabat.b11b12b14.051]|uniref:hypothetical protein n=1 Tax=Microcoleus sp. bin38.metabat.b11b12b14.051 TaxID=2742709 RepID=UPI0025FF4D64|nr:hypothetical protein [Microcoleus sp. bin38.metabat.b11b12b14.051]
MVSQQKSQGSNSPLLELFEKAKIKYGCNSWEEFAALISLKSGDQVSANTFRRCIKSGKKGWFKLSLSLVQWDAMAEITDISVKELPRVSSQEVFESTNSDVIDH